MIYVSASQISTKRDCKRKWGYRYIDKIKHPPKPAQKFGLEGHERAENWLRDGTDPGDDDVGLTFKQGIKPDYLPAPGTPGILVEHKIEIPILDALDVMMIGYIDLVVPPVPLLDLEVGTYSPPIVTDHKFTKDLRWAMEPEDLDGDPQAAIYSYWAMNHFKVNEVLCRWIYYSGRPNSKSEDGRPRKPRGARKVEYLFTRAQIEINWQHCLEDAAEIVEMKSSLEKAAEAEPNESSCSDYGGCEHRDYCPLSDESGLGAALKVYDMTHKRRLTRRASSGTGALSLLEEKKMEGTSLMDALRGKVAEQGTAPASPAETPPPVKEPGEAPPPVEEPPAAAEPAAEPAPSGFLAEMKNKAKKLVGVNPPKDETPKAVPAMFADAEVKTEPAAAEPAAAAPEPAAAEPTKTAEAKPKTKRKTTKPKKADSPGFIVALDAAAVKFNGAYGDVVNLTDLVTPITDAIAKEHRCDEHPKGVAHWGLIEYANGKSILAHQFAAFLDSDGFQGVLVVDGSTEEARAVKEVLMRRADLVIRGTR